MGIRNAPHEWDEGVCRWCGARANWPLAKRPCPIGIDMRSGGPGRDYSSEMSPDEAMSAMASTAAASNDS